MREALPAYALQSIYPWSTAASVASGTFSGSLASTTAATAAELAARLGARANKRGSALHAAAAAEPGGRRRLVRRYHADPEDVAGMLQGRTRGRTLRRMTLETDSGGRPAQPDDELHALPQLPRLDARDSTFAAAPVRSSLDETTRSSFDVNPKRIPAMTIMLDAPPPLGSPGRRPKP